MLDAVLRVFSVKPDHDLNIMSPGQTLIQSSARILAGLEGILVAERPDMVLVQGDTTSTFVGALAAFYLKIPVGHVEAGLRTGDVWEPFPEEMNRVLAGRLTSLHFAATAGAARNLQLEGVRGDSIVVTGNTGIDAVLYIREELRRGRVHGLQLPGLDAARKIILVTAHRRESFGEGLESVCAALRRLARRPDIQIVFPVHPNPNVRETVTRNLSGLPNVVLTDPLGYTEFVDLMVRSHLLLTDSGGVQEEGPSLGKPVLVMRDKTERPEAVESGTARLVGTGQNIIVEQVTQLLDSLDAYRRMTRVHNPYGDGHACEKIAAAIRGYFSADGLPAGKPSVIDAAGVSG
jgi:UDP-N-acetylglucosamine 2-epimerase (non-hydrolysing)